MAARLCRKRLADFGQGNNRSDDGRSERWSKIRMANSQRKSLAIAPPPAMGRRVDAALQAITSVRRPDWVDLATWNRQSSAEQLASITPSAGAVQLARVDARAGAVDIYPERSDFPAIRLPNNVGAEGFSPGWRTHDYLVQVYAPPALRGLAGLAAVGAALLANPTPGNDFPASPTGTVNNVGHLTGTDEGTNLVRSYSIRLTNPRRSAAMVNYTMGGEHKMDEGFVLRFAELKPNGSVLLVTYGEGNAWRQWEAFSWIWWPKIKRAWKRNALQVFQVAARGR